MAKNSRDNQIAPTMIIPRGTDISVDAYGQLSVRAPGNLVIQHSGHYGNLESVSGSIRIEPDVEVEAVSVQCPDTCYVQGSLTAWKVVAKSLQLEDAAKAHIVLQETEKLEVGKGARLVGNFTSEKELFFLFSRFSKQVRSLPLYREQTDGEAPVEGGVENIPLLADGHPEADGGKNRLISSSSEAGPTLDIELDDSLFSALMLLERTVGRGNHPEESLRVLRELIKLLRERDLETLKHTYRTLFGRVANLGTTVDRARDLVGEYFSKQD